VSLEQLRALYKSHAFEPRPAQDWYTATHVAFDQLFDTDTIETRVRHAVAAGGRVAIIGRSGTGKTSLVDHAVSDPALLPIWMHVAVENPELIVDPLGFGQLLVTAMVDTGQRYLSHADVDSSLAVAGERYQKEGSRRTARAGAGLNSGWSKLDVAREVVTAAPDVSRRVTVADVGRALGGLFDIVHSNSLIPVVIVDDSDRFLQIVAPETSAALDLLTPFVERVLPWLAALDCAKVVAVHPTYAASAQWAAARREGLAGDEIAVPVLINQAQIEAILTRRLEAFGRSAELPEVLDGQALATLFTSYRAQPMPTIRSCLTLASSAVVLACDQRADTVTHLHVGSAQADLG
jgi:hypothetical protein